MVASSDPSWAGRELLTALTLCRPTGCAFRVSDRALVKVQVLIALAPFQVFQFAGLFFELSTKSPDFILQFLHLDHQVCHGIVGSASCGQYGTRVAGVQK